jgi:hypothetical protein
LVLHPPYFDYSNLQNFPIKRVSHSADAVKMMLQFNEDFCLSRKIMLQTVEAEIDVSGQIRLLEPLRVSKKSRAIVTVLEESNGNAEEKGNSKKILEFLRNNRLSDSSRPSVEEIEAQILEARESWD